MAETMVVLTASVRILREGLFDVASNALSEFFLNHKITVQLVSLDNLDPGKKRERSPKAQKIIKS
jgi:hypothetical protein